MKLQAFTHMSIRMIGKNKLIRISLLTD